MIFIISTFRFIILYRTVILLKWSLSVIVGDFAFKCPVIQLAQNYAKSPGSSVYFYEFNHRPSVSDWPAWSGSLHGDEVQFLFGLTLKPEAAYTMDEQKLSQDMMQYWTNFAKTG